jgi:DNA helicase-2/ATP-dependent DNA helicase PcrA
MTRAKHHLALVVPQRFYVRQQRQSGDSYFNATLTRFIPGNVARLFEQVTPFRYKVKCAGHQACLWSMSVQSCAMWD